MFYIMGRVLSKLLLIIFSTGSLMSHTAESTYSTASDAFNKLQSITTTTEDSMIVGMSIGTSHSLMTSNVMSLTSHGTSAETPVTFESNNPTDVSKGNK